MSVKAEFHSMSPHFRLLERAGLIEPLQDWIADASQLEVTDLNGFAQNLKAIFNSLVDKQLGSSPARPLIKSPVKTPARTPPRTRPLSGHPRRPPASSSNRLHNTMSRSVKKLPTNYSKAFSRTVSRSSRLAEDLADISDFCFISGAATFNKTKRSTLPVHEPSPGPAAYDPCLEIAKQRSPRTLIPTSGTRVEFANYNSPGPAAYRPRRHFLAKY